MRKGGKLKRKKDRETKRQKDRKTETKTHLPAFYPRERILICQNQHLFKVELKCGKAER